MIGDNGVEVIAIVDHDANPLDEAFVQSVAREALQTALVLLPFAPLGI